MNLPCGCCDGISVVTPLPIANRPGLSALQYRIGTQATFLQSLFARLSSHELSSHELAAAASDVRALADEVGQGVRLDRAGRPGPLSRLGTRELDDLSIALLDAWSVLGDVLTFYQERIANEGFLRTAVQPRSMEELSRLVGYQPRPGVSASVYLAFTLDEPPPTPANLPGLVGFSLPSPPGSQQTTPGEVLIPKGTKVKSTPSPGSEEEPQTFETSRDLLARAEWNVLRPQTTQMPDLTANNPESIRQLTLEGTGLRLSPNDVLAFSASGRPRPILRVVAQVEENAGRQVTKVTFRGGNRLTQELATEIGELRLNRVSAFDFGSRHLLNAASTIIIARQRLEEAFRRFENPEEATNLSLAEFDRMVAEGLVERLRLLVTDSQEITQQLILNARAEVDDRLINELNRGIDEALHATKKHFVPVVSGLEGLSELKTWLESTDTPPPESEVTVRLLGHLSRSTLDEMQQLMCVGGADQESVGPPLHPLFTLVPPNRAETISPFTRGQLQVLTGNERRILRFLSTDRFGQDLINLPANYADELGRMLGSVTVEPSADARHILLLEVRSDDHVIAGALHTVSSGTPDTACTMSGIPASLYFPTDGDGRLLVAPTFSAPAGAPAPDPTRWVLRLELRSGAASGLQFTFNERQEIDVRTPAAPAAPPAGMLVPTPESQFVEAVKQVTVQRRPGATPSFPIEYILVSFFSAGAGGTRVPDAVGLIPVFVEPTASPETDLFAPVRAMLLGPGAPTGEALPASLEGASALHAIVAPLAILDTDSALSIVTTIEAMSAAEVPSPAEALAGFPARLSAALAAAKVNVIIALKTFVARIVLPEGPGEVETFLAQELAVTVAALKSTFETDAAQVAKASDYDELLHRATTVKNEAYVPFGRHLLGIRAEVFRVLTRRRRSLLAAIRDLATGARDSLTDEERARVDLFLDWIDDRSNEIDASHSTMQSTVAGWPASSPSPGSSGPMLSQLACCMATAMGIALDTCACPEALSPPKLLNGESSPELGRLIAVVLQRIAQESDQIVVAPVVPDGNLETILDRLRQTLSGHNLVPAVSDADLSALFSAGSDFVTQLIQALNPEERNRLEQIMRVHRVNSPEFETRVAVLRASARVFGWNAPRVVTKIEPPGPPHTKEQDPTKPNKETTETESNKRIYLDGAFKAVRSGDAIAIRREEMRDYFAFRVLSARTRPRTAYDISGECTEVELDGDESWWKPHASSDPDDYRVVRSTRVLCEAEVLRVAPEPLLTSPQSPATEPKILPVEGREIVLEGVTVGLDTTRPLVVVGVPTASASDKVVERQLVRVRSVRYLLDRRHVFGEMLRTRIELDRSLPPLHRDSLKIYANVVEATHGETHREILGAGDGVQEFLELPVRRERVSQVPAPTPRGVERALAVSVNNVRWDEREQLHDAGRDEQCYVTHVSDQQMTSVVFGDGEHGVRPPTGQDNIRAVYRSGLGTGGNVKSAQIDQVVGGPLGVKGVSNPLPATGGTEPDAVSHVRARAPLAVTAMDRLVSTQDYADFALNFGGIGRATAERRGRVVHVTVAGTVPDPLPRDGLLLRNLEQALRLAGDPSQQFELHPHRPSLLVIVAKVAIDPRREWALVEWEVRKVVGDTFHFERADFSKDAFLSSLIATIQGVAGVEYVDVDTFDAVQSTEAQILTKKLAGLSLRPRIEARGLESAPVPGPPADGDPVNAANGRDANDARGRTEPPGGGSPNGNSAAMELVGAELIYLTPDVPDTLILEQIP